MFVNSLTCSQGFASPPPLLILLLIVRAERGERRGRASSSRTDGHTARQEQGEENRAGEEREEDVGGHVFGLDLKCLVHHELYPIFQIKYISLIH